MEYPPRIQRLLNKKDRTKGDDAYLAWYGAIGPGSELRDIVKEHNSKQQGESSCTKQRSVYVQTA